MALMWFMVSAVRARVPVYQVRAGHPAAVRARSTDHSTSIYAAAQHHWADQVSAAQVQTARWRTAAIGSSVLCMVLGGAVASALSTQSVPHIIAAEDPAKLWLGLAQWPSPSLRAIGYTEEARRD